MDPYHRKFFSLAELKQPVNQWICIAFLGVWCFWIVLYYFTTKTDALAENYVDNYVNIVHASRVASSTLQN